MTVFKLQNWSDCFTGREDLGVQLIQQIRRLMVQDTATDDIERGFVYWVGDVKQRIWVEEGRRPVDFTLWKIHIQTEFLKPKGLKEATPLVELANYAATLGFCALIPDGENGWLLANTIVAHQDIARAIPQMVCSAATVQFMHALQDDRLPPFIGKHYEPARSRATVGKADPELSAGIVEAGQATLVSRGQPPKHLGEELTKTLELLQSPPCLLATGDENVICAEFPFGAATSMLHVDAAAYHPWFMNCCSIKLLFQIEGTEEKAAEAVFGLNHKEATDPECRAHLFGSWCLTTELGASIGFTMFLPHSICQNNQILNLTMSSAVRATWAGKCLTGRDWENDFEAGQRLIEARLKKIMSSEEGRAKVAADAQRDFDRRALAKATAVTQQLGSQSGLLANPIALTNDFFRHAKSQSLFVCGLFNAMGPTWNIVSLVSVGSEDGFLLCHRMLNPFQQVNHAWGRFKDGTGRAAKDVCDAVIELFRRNGSATAPMLASMPSWFLGHAFDDHYEHLGAKALAAFALQHQPDLQSEIELYQRVPNPWERASQAVESAMAGLDARKTKPHSLPKAGTRKVDEALISKWMEVVTSEDHLLPEIIGMAQAWVGCLEYQRKHGNAELAGAALSFADLDAYLKSLKFDLFDKIDWQSAGQS